VHLAVPNLTSELASILKSFYFEGQMNIWLGKENSYLFCFNYVTKVIEFAPWKQASHASVIFILSSQTLEFYFNFCKFLFIYDLFQIKDLPQFHQIG